MASPDTFNTALSALFGDVSVVPAGRASLGIYAALRAWGGTGAVAVQSAVCQDVIAAILMAGRRPFFLDIDPQTGLTLDSEWQRARNAGADAAIFVHLYGNTTNTAAARNAFSGKLLIDDAAQALGAKNSCGKAGMCGDVGVISFGHTKHIEIGGAAILCRDKGIASACADILRKLTYSSSADIQRVEIQFRQRFGNARKLLISPSDPSGFVGLLDNYDIALRVPWQNEWGNLVASQLNHLAELLAQRALKVQKWSNGLRGSLLKPLSINEGASPWRFTCRLHNANWGQQFRIGEALRRQKVNVSHWYLPAHWLLGLTDSSLPGVEQLAQEAFQFWIDEKTPLTTIETELNIIKTAPELWEK